MSEHDHDADRDLDDFLNRRSPLSQAWRDAVDGQRAPEALDAAVLDAARRAPPVPAPKPTSRLRRWRAPIGLAASLLVGIGVLREGLRDDRLREQLSGEPALMTAEAERHMASDAARRREVQAMERQASPALPRLAPQLPPPASAMSAPAAPPPGTVPPMPPAPARAPEPIAAASPPPAAAVPPSTATAAEAQASDAAARKAESSASAPVVVPSAAAADTRAAGASPPRMADAWQPARYRGLLLGQATVDEVLRRHPVPEVDTATRARQALLPDGRQAHRLLDYGRGLDPRGRVRLYFDASSEVLASVDLVLEPPLALADVQAMEGLVGEGLPGVAEAAPCPASRLPPGALDAQSVAQPDWPQVRGWPGQGVQLLLAGPDRVVEIHYLERCW